MYPSLRLMSVCSLVSVAVTLSGCVPYPAYKLVQPEASATILDEQHRPLPDARVVLVIRAYPGTLLDDHSEQRTGDDGKASFEAHHEWQAESLMIHGRHFYYWNWCVEKPGYETFSTAYHRAEDFDAHPAVRLKPGVSRSCDRFPPR